MFAFSGLGAPELILIFLVILLLFGAKRLPELARGLGKSIAEFKKASSQAEAEIREAIYVEPTERQPAARQAMPPSANPAPQAQVQSDSSNAGKS
jgi:sec-independent protein translocase protein TatA